MAQGKTESKESVDFTQLHNTLKTWKAKLDVVFKNTKAPKVQKIQETIEKLQAEIDCQSSMVIDF